MMTPLRRVVGLVVVGCCILLNLRKSTTGLEEVNIVGEEVPSTLEEEESDHKSLAYERDLLVSKWKDFATPLGQASTNGEHEPKFLKLPDFLAASSSSTQRDVVLATHMSMSDDNLQRLEILQRFWKGPISLAVLIRSEEEIKVFLDGLVAHHKKIQSLHVLFEYHANRNAPFLYPHNMLRNMALHSPGIVQDYALAVDLDFIPTWGGYSQIMELLDRHPELWDQMKNEKTLLVWPLLEIRGKDSTTTTGNHGKESDLPKSRTDLRALWETGRAREWHTASGQHPTDLPKYWTYNDSSDPAYEVIPTTAYEPFFLAYRPNLPRYWEGFRGFELDKIAFVRECIVSGHQFRVLWPLYLTHLAHPSRLDWDQLERNRMAWQIDFGPYLRKQYKGKAVAGGRRLGSMWFACPTKKELPQQPATMG